jgi:hypothetical protein
MNLVKRFISVLALLTLAACGGGSNGAGDPPFGGVDGGGNGGTGGGTSPTAADVVLVLNAASIANDGSETITATATALDANRNALAKVPLVISVNSNAVATASGTVTDDTGVVTADITIGSDNSNRIITVTATSGSISRSTALEVRDPVAGGVGSPVLQVALSSTSISAASPATVTASLKDVKGAPVSGVVVAFEVPRGLAQTNVPTALTNAAGQAVVVLSPTNSTSAGADEIIATTTYAGSSLSETRGFQVQSTNVTIESFLAASNPLSAYGQTPLTIRLEGASTTTPVNMSVTSACVVQGKASVSPSTFSTTSETVTLQYRDNGCGAIQTADQLQVVVDGTATSRSLTLNIDPPAAASLAFVGASPEEIYLRGSGFTENSTVTFEVRDAAGNPLPGRTVELRLQTGAGGVTMEGRGVESINPPSATPFTQTSNAQGRVSVRINSGTQPTPVRVNAKLQDTTISTVSSNLSVATGLPAQLSFSLSQTTRNIEGYNIDGTVNQYNIIAADRSGNPVPAGTSINFVSEGGQIQAIRQIQLVNGIARTTANYVSSGTRPVDGRVTITAYALGEESFIDLDGNNVHNSNDPFQDLGNVFLDRNFDGVFDDTVDEFIPLNINNDRNCAPITNNLLALDNSIPSDPDTATCSGNWSGAGQVYVRRAAETVLSTSAARPLWFDTRGLSNTCLNSRITLQVGPDTAQTAVFTAAGEDIWYGENTTTDSSRNNSGTISLRVADANPGRPKANADWADPAEFNPNTDYIEFPRLNPMAAGTVITATTPTTGFNVTVGGGTPVASTTEATRIDVAYNFTDPAVQRAVIFMTFRSPSGTGTPLSVTVSRAIKPSNCPG